MLLFNLLLASLLAVEVLDIEMNADEKKQTGVAKLNEKEKARLLSWIDQYYVKREQPLAEKPITQRSMLQENLQNGKYIRLADKTTWNIRPQDVAIVQGWITPVDISVTQSGDSTYPYRLTNTISGSSVMARKVDNYSEPSTPQSQPNQQPTQPIQPPTTTPAPKPSKPTPPPAKPLPPYTTPGNTTPPSKKQT